MEDEAQYKKVAKEKKKNAEDDLQCPPPGSGIGGPKYRRIQISMGGYLSQQLLGWPSFHFPQLPRLLGRFHQQQPSPSPSHPFPTPFSARILLHPIRPVEIQKTVRILSILTACLGRDTLLLSRYLEYDAFILYLRTSPRH
jgi:hypothetical protein